MSTVPGPDTPAPADNNKTLTIGDGSGMYARPTAGGNAVGETPEGGSSNTPAGAVPANPIRGSLAEINDAASPSAGGAQVGPDIGHGASEILTGISGGGDTDNDGDTQ